uniref:Uncharacterized protein n=1 Tax=Varanus komodoensis TaxID=61221 RepID=A0A8D2ITF5_VARKO
MATKGMYKLDDGNCYPTNCFPARSLLRPRYEEGNVTQRPLDMARSIYLNCPGLDFKPGLIWKQLFLCRFLQAKEDEFEEFNSVAYINATENLLTLGKECIAILVGLNIGTSSSPGLLILDLSYNNLSPEDVQALGVLPHLKVLHLTVSAATHGNHIGLFPALEVLLLNDNHLSHPNVFVSLQGDLTPQGVGDARGQAPALGHRPACQAQSMRKSRGCCPSRGSGRISFPWRSCLPSAALSQPTVCRTWIREAELASWPLHQGIHSLRFPRSPTAGDPPLLTSFLQNKLGIKTIRKKVSKPEKPRLFIPIKANRKVWLERRRMLLRGQWGKERAAVLPLSLFTHNDSASGETRGKSRGPCKHRPLSRLCSNLVQRKRLSLHLNPFSSLLIPPGIQQNVRALENALRHQRVYRDSKARLDSFQKPYVPMRKKVQRVPAPPAAKTKAERLEEILLKMREPTNIVQVPLGRCESRAPGGSRVPQWRAGRGRKDLVSGRIWPQSLLTRGAENPRPSTRGTDGAGSGSVPTAYGNPASHRAFYTFACQQMKHTKAPSSNIAQ